MRKFLLSALTIVTLFFLSHPSFSATLLMTKLGTVDTTGKNYSEWWYTGINPTLYGKATPSSEITITIDDVDKKITSTAAGDWVATTTMAIGDHKVKIVQGTEALAFTVHIGSNVPTTTAGTTVTSPTTAPVPDTGINQTVAIMFGLGVLILSGYFYLQGDPKRHLSFEEKFQKED